MLLSLFALLFTSPTFAKEAVIRFGNQPMYGNEMRILHDNRVSHRLSDLEESGGGEDEEFVLACYEGSLEDVCKIVETAIAEENDKENNRKGDALKLKSCEIAKPRRMYAENSILVDIESKKGGKFRFPQLTPCKK